MTTWWRAWGTAYRRPGTMAAIPAENESVHWSVFTLTSHFRTQSLIHDAFIEVLIEPCWSFRNASIDDLREEPRSWPPRDADPPGRKIEEAKKHKVEEDLIQWWSGDVLRALQDNAQAGDGGGQNSLFIMLTQSLF